MNDQEERDTIVVMEVLRALPSYVFGYVVGMIASIFSTVTLTSLCIGSIAVGFAVSPWAGIAIFFLMHTLIKMTNSLASAIYQAGRTPALSVARFANVFATTETAKPLLESDPGE